MNSDLLREIEKEGLLVDCIIETSGPDGSFSGRREKVKVIPVTKLIPMMREVLKKAFKAGQEYENSNNLSESFEEWIQQNT